MLSKKFKFYKSNKNNKQFTKKFCFKGWGAKKSVPKYMISSFLKDWLIKENELSQITSREGKKERRVGNEDKAEDSFKKSFFIIKKKK